MTDNKRRLFDAQHTGEFTLAGNARLTLVSDKTGTRYTYRVTGKTGQSGNEIDIWFVSVLYGPDNGADYSYIGQIYKNALRYQHGKKSKISPDDKRSKAFAYFWEGIRNGKIPAFLQVWHEGRCGRCSRPLTVPMSIESGFGPECSKHIA